MTARRKYRLQALATELEQRVVPIRCDVSVPGDRAPLIKGIVDRFGRIDVLVNNAGTSDPGPAEDETIEQFERVVQVNLTSLFSLCQLAGKVMLEQMSGSIINISSMFGLVAAAPFAQASYTASKGAVVNLTRELACQWARRGVRANSIAPGFFHSEMTAVEFFGNEKAFRSFTRNCPMARAGDPHELDGLILLQASEASSYITGQTIAVDGGWTAR